MYKIIENKFIYNNLPNIPSCHSSTLVELSTGDILAAWFGGTEEGSPSASHYVAVLPKGQRDWKEPELFWNVADKSAGNPRLFCDSQQRVWAILPINDGKWCSGGTRFYYRISEDNGLNWQEPVYVPSLDMYLGKNKPVHLSNGNIVIPVTCEVTQTSFAVILDPDQKTWDISEEIGIQGSRCIQPSFTILSDGRLMGLLRTNIGHLWKTYSEDGYVWSEPEQTELPNNNSGIDMVSLKTGEIILLYNDISDEKFRTPLVAAISSDDGESWSEKIMIESGEGEFSYPAVIQSSAGDIHITYTYLKGPREGSGRNGTHIKYVKLSQAMLAANI